MAKHGSVITVSVRWEGRHRRTSGGLLKNESLQTGQPRIRRGNERLCQTRWTVRLNTRSCPLVSEPWHVMLSPPCPPPRLKKKNLQFEASQVRDSLQHTMKYYLGLRRKKLYHTWQYELNSSISAIKTSKRKPLYLST